MSQMHFSRLSHNAYVVASEREDESSAIIIATSIVGCVMCEVVMFAPNKVFYGMVTCKNCTCNQTLTDTMAMNVDSDDVFIYFPQRLRKDCLPV